MRTPERRTPGGPLRADAQRNRDEILTAAVRVLGEQGLDANLDRIARDAGGGAGTLYRNFPTREALVEAASRNEFAHLCEAAPVLLESMPPRDALRAWMGRFLDYATAKLGMADALRVVIDSALASGQPEQRDQAERLLNLAIDGLIAGTSASR